MEHTARYEEYVKAGKFLVIAQGDPAEAEWAQSLPADTGPEELTLHDETRTSRLPAALHREHA